LSENSYSLGNIIICVGGEDSFVPNAMLQETIIIKWKKTNCEKWTEGS